MEKVLDTPWLHLHLIDDLLIGTYKKNKKLTLEQAKEIVRMRLEFTGPEPVVALVFDQGVMKMDKDARDYLSSPDGLRGFKAAALVLNNPFSFLLGNFYVYVTKVSFPVRFFTKKDAAMKWLQKYRK